MSYAWNSFSVSRALLPDKSTSKRRDSYRIATINFGEMESPERFKRSSSQPQQASSENRTQDTCDLDRRHHSTNLHGVPVINVKIISSEVKRTLAVVILESGYSAVSWDLVERDLQGPTPEGLSVDGRFVALDTKIDGKTITHHFEVIKTVTGLMWLGNDFCSEVGIRVDKNNSVTISKHYSSFLRLNFVMSKSPPKMPRDPCDATAYSVGDILAIRNLVPVAVGGGVYEYKYYGTYAVQGIVSSDTMLVQPLMNDDERFRAFIILARRVKLKNAPHRAGDIVWTSSVTVESLGQFCQFRSIESLPDHFLQPECGRSVGNGTTTQRAKLPASWQTEPDADYDSCNQDCPMNLTKDRSQTVESPTKSPAAAKRTPTSLSKEPLRCKVDISSQDRDVKRESLHLKKDLPKTKQSKDRDEKSSSLSRQSGKDASHGPKRPIHISRREKPSMKVGRRSWGLLENRYERTDAGKKCINDTRFRGLNNPSYYSV